MKHLETNITRTNAKGCDEIGENENGSDRKTRARAVKTTTGVCMEMVAMYRYHQSFAVPSQGCLQHASQLGVAACRVVA